MNGTSIVRNGPRKWLRTWWCTWRPYSGRKPPMHIIRRCAIGEIATPLPLHESSWLIFLQIDLVPLMTTGYDNSKEETENDMYWTLTIRSQLLSFRGPLGLPCRASAENVYVTVIECPADGRTESCWQVLRGMWGPLKSGGGAKMRSIFLSTTDGGESSCQFFIPIFSSYFCIFSFFFLPFLARVLSSLL